MTPVCWRADNLGMQKRSSMPRDPNQLAKMIADMATGEAEPEPKGPEKNSPRLRAEDSEGLRAVRRGPRNSARRSGRRLRSGRRWQGGAARRKLARQRFLRPCGETANKKNDVGKSGLGFGAG